MPFLDTDHRSLSSLIPPLTHCGEASRTPSPAEQPHLVEPWLLSPALPDHPKDNEGRSPPLHLCLSRLGGGLASGAVT